VELPYNRRDFFAVFIDNGTEPFVRESDSHLADFSNFLQFYTILNL